ncbi:MAG: outer membrane protein assembly factor BamA [Nitrospirota bacterium]
MIIAAIFCHVMFFAVPSYASIVDEIKIHGLYSMGENELLYLLDIEPGKRIDAGTITMGIKRAFLKGIFQDIRVQAGDGERVKVTINVVERYRIDDIYVEGDHAPSKRTVKKLFLLKEGDILKCVMFGEAERDLERKLAIRGYPETRVNKEIEKLKKPYNVNLHLRVDTGIPDVIKKINISGATNDVVDMMKLSEGDVFDQTLLRKDLERIKIFFKKKGHFNPVVGPYNFTNGTLDIAINPGRRLTITVEGNESISSKTLMKELPFFEVEDFSDVLVDEAVHRMLSLYHADGHPFVQIAPVVTTKDNLISANFFVYEGPEVKIDKISFKGNSLPEKSLKEILSLKEGGIFNPDLLENDREALRDFYNALGYLSAHIEEPETGYHEDLNKMGVTIKINEGLQTKIGNINVVGMSEISEEEIRNLIRIKPGDAYNEIDLSDVRYRIIEFYNSKGFPGVKVSVEREFEDGQAFVTFDIEEGPHILFGKTIITGNDKTRYKVLRRALEPKEDNPFDYGILTRERQRLYKLGLFTDIEMEVLDRYDSRKDVLMKLREGNAGAVELSLGYAEYERLRGILGVSYRNLFGMNRQASARLELSSLEKRLVLQYYEPWFAGRNIPFRTFILSEEKKEINIDTRETRYRLRRNSATAGFEKKLSNTIKSELYYEFSLVETFDVQPDVILSREDTGTLVISGLRFGLIYDTRDHPFYPRKGILSGISAKLTGPVFFSETDFLKVMLHFNIYHELTRGVVLAASLRGGVAQGYGETRELPIVERFFLGGRTTVRGYDQDTLGPKGSDGTPTGGNAFLMENLEIRTSLGRGIGLVAFLDGGNVWVKTEEMNLADFKFTAGLGLRYNTPVGPIRIDYGHKLQREEDESSGEIHFSIGHAF